MAAMAAESFMAVVICHSGRHVISPRSCVRRVGRSGVGELLASLLRPIKKQNWDQRTRHCLYDVISNVSMMSFPIRGSLVFAIRALYFVYPTRLLVQYM